MPTVLDQFRLDGRVAIVTGASSGLGVGFAQAVAQAGADLVLAARREDRLADTRKLVEAEGRRAVTVRADISDPDDGNAVVAAAINEFGRVDILVNNAGIYEFSPLEGVTEEHFHKHFDLNVLGLIFASQEAIKHFGSAGGSIINISSVASTAAPANTSVYSATKASVDAVTKSLAKELGPRKIRVNAINPGMVETEGVHAAGIMESDFRKEVESKTPLGRIGQSEDIAPAVVFLASEESRWITGETMRVSGGLN
jgi:3-oxoacyl-[acyl-carrier protein] reductase